jgi:hypothetical protein
MWTVAGKKSYDPDVLITGPRAPLIMSEPSSATPDSAPPVLSQEEVRAALQSLTVAEKTAMNKAARFFARTTSEEHIDLIQETFLRLLGGERKWRKDLPRLVVLNGVMRSIAWEWKQRERREEP